MPVKVHKVYPEGFASNSYIVTADGKTCAVIDCAQPRVWDKCVQLGLTPQAVLLTHGHYDHIGGCARFAENGVPIYLSEEEGEHIFTPDYTSLSWYKVSPFPVRTLGGGQTVTAAGIDFKVISTPGHTSGGVCYLAENCLFTGDTLFCESVGRCDLPTGSYSQLVTSVKKLYALLGDYAVYCGHEEDTTLSHERESNPFIRAD